MTKSLKDISIAVDLVSLRRAMFAAHKESSRSVLEESDCNLLDPSPGGEAGGAVEVGGSGVESQTQLHSGASLDYMRPSLK